jgi:hypothetical protein
LGRVLEAGDAHFGGVRLRVPGLESKGAGIILLGPAEVAPVVRAAVVPETRPPRGRAKIGMLIFPAGQGWEVGLKVVDPKTVADAAGFRRFG